MKKHKNKKPRAYKRMGVYEAADHLQHLLFIATQAVAESHKVEQCDK